MKERGMSGRARGLLILILACAMLAGTAFAWESDVSAAVTKPDKPTLSSVKSSKVKQLTVTWKQVEKADGYIVWYKTGDNKAKKKTVKTKAPADPSKPTQSVTLKNLLGGKDYSVKVRSYRLDQDGSGDTGTEKVKSDYSKTKTAAVKHDKWSDLKDKYAVKEKVKQIIFVKYKGNSKATLVLYTKKSSDGKDGKGEDVDPVDPELISWKKVLSCDAYTGQNGLGKTKEGDRKTPTGEFTLTKAFGVKKDPGSKMKYTKLKDYHYWCGDKDHYNKMIDIRKYPHSCRGEHLINYTKQYAYTMALNYNKKCVYGKGSAIFLHCFGYNPYTLGCVAVSEDNMKTILKTCGKSSKICIYNK